MSNLKESVHEVAASPPATSCKTLAGEGDCPLQMCPALSTMGASGLLVLLQLKYHTAVLNHMCMLRVS